VMSRAPQQRHALSLLGRPRHALLVSMRKDFFFFAPNEAPQLLGGEGLIEHEHVAMPIRPSSFDKGQALELRRLS
jgi:hypothetical protein